MSKEKAAVVETSWTKAARLIKQLRELPGIEGVTIYGSAREWRSDFKAGVEVMAEDSAQVAPTAFIGELMSQDLIKTVLRDRATGRTLCLETSEVLAVVKGRPIPRSFP